MTLQLTKKHSFDAVFDSQKIFRLILEATSNPPRAVNIKKSADTLFGSFPVFLAVAMTLLDSETSFSAPGNDPLAKDIASLTLARVEDTESADFVFVQNPDHLKHVVETAKCGTLADPHKSTTVVVQSDGAPIYNLRLSGPGIDGIATNPSTRTLIEAMRLRDAQNYEYPQGIDFLFVSSMGDLFAIPRLVKVVV